MGVKFVCGVAVGTDITLNDLDNQYNAVFLAIGTWKEAWVYLPGHRVEGRDSGAALPRSRGQGGAGAAGPQGGGDRRRQRGHRFGPHRAAHGRRGHRDLPPRAQGHARHSRRRPTPPKPRARSSSSWPRRTASWATTRATSRPSRWSRPRSASSTPPAAARPCPPTKSAASSATPSSWPWAKPWTWISLRASGLRIKENGTLEVDRYTLETSRSKFYAGGDLITGASNVSNAMGYGKKAARTIDQRLMGAVSLGQDRRRHSRTARRRPTSRAPAARHTLGELPARERVESFREAVVGADRRGSAGRSRRAACAATSRITTIGQSACLKKYPSESTANTFRAHEGQTILEVARASGKYIPTLCWLAGTSQRWAPAACASWRSPAWAACCPPAPPRCRTA